MHVAQDDLAGHFARGVAWSGIAKVIAQSVAWLSTLFVARYLSPTDYGLFGLAMLYLGLLQLIADLGLGVAVLANRHLSDDDLPQINGLAALSGVLGSLLVAATSPLVGWFFNAPQLPLLLVALSPTFFINSLRTVPQSLLQREFRFKWLALVDAGQAILLSVITVALAIAGFGYWTLVAAAIASAVVNTSIVLWRRRVPSAWPDMGRLRPVLAFSAQVVLQRIAWYCSSNADFATAGKLLGKEAAGNYILAWNFANAPLERVANLILQVSPPVLGAARNDPAALKAHVLRATSMIAFLVFPMCVGMSLVARPFVTVFLGDKWEGAILPLQLLSAYTAVRSLIPLLGQVLLVVGEEYYATRLMFANVVVMTTAFIIGANVAGVGGIAAAYVIAHPLIASAYGARTLKRIQCSAMEFFAIGVWPALSCTLCMAVAVALTAYLTMSLPLGFSLFCQIAGGAVVYALVGWLLYRDRLVRLVSVLRATTLPVP